MGNPKGVRRDFEALERRRLQAVALLDQGLNESEVARRLKVSHTSVNRWAQVRAEEGSKGLKRAGRAGRKPRLSAEDLKRLEQGLLRGPEALGYETPLWTLWRVGHLIEQEFGVRYHKGHVWRILRQLNWSCQRPVGRARERDEKAIEYGKKVEWPRLKKAQQEGCTLVFIDESGLSQSPHHVRTWARRGQTPVLDFNFNYATLSAVAGMTFWNFYFQLFPKSVRSPQVIEFLGHLKRYLRQPVLVIWDRLSAHQSRMTQQWIEEQKGWIRTASLPAYAPEVNPMEYQWGYWKQHELPNVCPRDYWQLDDRARRALKRIRRKCCKQERGGRSAYLGG
jgi:transposase